VRVIPSITCSVAIVSCCPAIRRHTARFHPSHGFITTIVIDPGDDDTDAS